MSPEKDPRSAEDSSFLRRWMIPVLALVFIAAILIAWFAGQYAGPGESTPALATQLLFSV